MRLEDIELEKQYKTKDSFIAVHCDTDEVVEWDWGKEVVVFGKNDAKFARDCSTVLVEDSDGYVAMVAAHMLEGA